MREEGYDAESLEDAMGYNSDGLLVRTYLGELESARQPSQAFIDKLSLLGFDGSRYRSSAHLAKGVIAKEELPPGTIVMGNPVQCPECVAEAEEGKRPWTKTWYVFSWGNQKYCCREHRSAWYRRQRAATRDCSSD